MRESYLTKAFRKTAHERFPEREAVLNSAFEKRLGELRSEHAGASGQRMQHLESQIMPGIAAYKTLQTVMPKEEALQTVHGYVEERAYRLKKIFLRLMRIPGLYKKVPDIFATQTPKLFGISAGFEANEIRTTGGVWRIDMTRCPITTNVCAVAVRSCAGVSVTATISHMMGCIRSSSGREP